MEPDGMTMYAGERGLVDGWMMEEGAVLADPASARQRPDLRENHLSCQS